MQVLRLLIILFGILANGDLFARDMQLKLFEEHLLA